MCHCFCVCKVCMTPCGVLVSCSVLLILVVVGVALTYWSDISGGSDKKTWTCSNSSCKICENLKDSSIHLNNKMCANITYFSEDDVFLYIVSVNQTTIVNETLTDAYIPPACSNVSFIDNIEKACIYWYDMNVSNSTLHVCAKIETTEKLHLLKKYELGCIDVHPITKNNKTIVAKIDPTVFVN